jgi:hypothetical protein
MSDKLKDFDFLSRKTHLFLNGSSRIKTILGGVLTIILFLVGTASAIYMFKKIMIREDPTVYQNKVFQNSLKFTINTTENVIALRLIDLSGLEFDETTFSVYAQMMYYKAKSSSLDNYKFDKVVKPVKISKCGENYKLNSTEFKNLFASFDFYNYYCLDMGQLLTIENSFGFSSDFSFLNFYITSCNHRSDCKKTQLSDKILDAFYVGLMSTQYSADNQNFNEPLQPYLFRYVDLSSSTVYKRTYLDLKNLNYVSDNGLFLTDKVYYNKTAFDKVKSTSDFRFAELNKAKIYYQLTLSLNPEGIHDTYFRNYLKIPTILASVGGFMNTLKICSTFFLYFFFKVSFIQTIFSNYFIYSKENCKYEDLKTRKKIYITKENQINSVKIINNLCNLKSSDVFKDLPSNLNQSDIVCANSNRNQFPTNLKFLQTLRKNQRKYFTNFNNSSQLNLNNLEQPNLGNSQILTPHHNINENQFFESSVLEKENSNCSNFSTNHKIKFTEMSSKKDIFKSFICAYIYKRKYNSAKFSIYNLAKQKLINYYLNINSLIDLRNEVNFLKKLLLIEKPIEDLCENAKKIISLKGSYKQTNIKVGMRRLIEQKLQNLDNEMKQTLNGYLYY